MSRSAALAGRVLAIVPCLDEEANIERVVGRLLDDEAVGIIVVADGGSSDGTRSIVAQLAAHSDRVELLDNPDRIQSTAVNRAVARHGDDYRWLVRVDAHCAYPANYVSCLLSAAERAASQSVVVSMETIAGEGFSAGAAAAQNSRLGTGGSAHRASDRSGYVDHGHHAMMEVEAFRRAGGYCENMPCNEDAELDVRLRRQGSRIWLEPSAMIGYYPRGTPAALFRQYYRYGIGRATTVRRHREKMRARQILPLLIAPCVGALFLSPLAAFVHSLLAAALALPALAWAGLCQGWGVKLAFEQRRADVLYAGTAAMIMHFAWSLGFWRQLVEAFLRPAASGSEPLLPFSG